jgi:hypothetical protein
VIFSLSFASTLVSEDVLSGEVDMRRDLGSDSDASIGSLVSFSGSGGGGEGLERFDFEDEASEFSRGRTTPAVYAREIFGMLGFLALLRKPFFHAATDVGVLGLCSSALSSLLSYVFLEGGIYEVDVLEVGVAKGSEYRNVWALWEAEWKELFVFVTRELKFDARREDFRGGGKAVLVLLEDMRERSVVEAA